MNSSSEEWLSNLIPYLKRVLLTTLLLPQTTKLYKKPQPKNDDQFDLFGSATKDNETATTHQQYYNILENTTHLYQSIQGDLGIKLLVAKFTEARFRLF
jgi:hypothetical protein